ncbi:MAG: Rpn family recombination-promoting nuclease/putative transposase [Lachnospiraceae bacterium]|nr:Rpn family recombination-promoting nuclease/putative transposase [Lachnospiraceae bacterium]
MDITKENCYNYHRNIPYEKLTLADDFMFFKVMQNEKLCKELLEIILGVEIEKIVYNEGQKVFKDTFDGKSVRLDVYLKDANHTVYDLEMQTTHTKELPKRTRYYHSIIDRGQLKAGKTYNDLTDSYVIFICTFDLFGLGIAKYSFESICEENKKLHLQDGHHTIFINAEGITNNKKLKEFLDYLQKGIVSNSPFVKELDDAVKNAAVNAEWKEEYEMLVAREQVLVAQGREEGRSEGRAEMYKSILTMIKKGLISLNDVLSTIQDKEDFQKWLDEQEK